MSNNAGLQNAPLRQDLEFNWVFLVELVLCGVLTLFFLFYFNRVIAALLSYGFRTWTWHKYRVFIDVQSFQVSLLAGRVFFKGLRYHGDNETIFIQSGYITWRYWFRNVRQLELSRDYMPSASSYPKRQARENVHRKEQELEGLSASLPKLPCRLTISLNGLEWFIYNRSIAYDAIADCLISQDPEITVPEEKLRSRQESSKNSGEKEQSFSNIENSKSTAADNLSERRFTASKQPTTPLNGISNCEKRFSTPPTPVKDTLLLRFLPLQIDCEKAAVVVGNHNTKSVLVTKIDKLQGKIDASDPSSKLDLYRQLINIQFENPVIQIKPNNDYREDQTVTGSRIAQGKFDSVELKQHCIGNVTFLSRQCHKIWDILKKGISGFRSPLDSYSVQDKPKDLSKSEPGSHNWQGLSRYLDEHGEDDDYKWTSTEYASVSTIFESPSVIMDFYWDEVGLVQEESKQSEQERFTDNINGDNPPELGINLSIGAAIINYGPWADRQRADIQKNFFPGLCKDITRATQLTVGQSRVWTELKLNIEFDEESVLRVPTKEASNNWKWKNQADVLGKNPVNPKISSKQSHKTKRDVGTNGPEARPFGWIDIKFGASSSVSYRIDLVAGLSGYTSELIVSFPTAEIMTSINHGLLWKSTNFRIYCDMSNPLKWNSCRTWKFDFTSTNLELFILREHIFLFTDLVDDWGSGPPPDYLTFCPFKYLINFHLNDFKIYFNVNDSNIINNPSDFDDNTFVVFWGSVINSNILIPLNQYRPYRNEITFDIYVEYGGLNLLVPPWNTQATFLPSKDLSTLKSLTLRAKYQYCLSTSSGNVDTLLLDVNTKFLSAKIYGFAIRYLFKIKDNYFGDNIQFTTLEEYQDLLSSSQGKRNPQKPYKNSNDLDIIVSFFVDSCSLTLPSNLYSADSNIRISITNVASDLRFTNYFMEYNLDISTVAFSPEYGNHSSKDLGNSNSTTELFLEGVRIFCNRLFGIPPAEPTYVCNWDFFIGPVAGECSTEFLRLIICGARAFSFTFDDDENALPSIIDQITHDITFLRVSLESLNLWLHVEESAIFLSTAKISVNFSDWAGPRYTKRMNILIPGLKLGCVDTESALGLKSRSAHQFETDALVQSTLSIVMIEKNLRFEKDRLLQQEHLQRHDQRTHRSDFLLDFEILDRNTRFPVELPTMKAPPMPFPVIKENVSKDHHGILGSKSFRSHKTNRNSSFLSIVSSSTKRKIVPKSLSKNTELRNLESCSERIRYSDECRHVFLHQDFPASKNDQPPISGNDRSFNVASSPTPFLKPYIRPNFPLLNVEPDISNLPESSIDPKEPALMSEEKTKYEADDLNPPENSHTHTSVIVSFTEVVKGYIKPKAIHAIANLLAALQAVDPADLLDQLQIDSIGEVLKNRSKSSGTVFDLCLHMPSLNFRLLNPSSSFTSLGVKNQVYDQLDLSISGLVINSKLKSNDEINEVNASEENTSTIHMSISSASFSAREKQHDMKENQAAINSVLKNLCFWVTLKHESAAHLQFKSLELATSCNQIEYVASLLQRTMNLATSFTDIFSALSQKQKIRLKLLVYLISKTGLRTAEPLFLARPSYVLRLTTGHLRTKDSWVIIARLHHMYDNLDVLSQHEIASRCFEPPGNSLQNIQEQMQSILTRFRTWNPQNLNDCKVISKIFGNSKDTSLPPFLKTNFRFSLRTGFIWLVIDPGPKQNGISMSQIALNFKNTRELPNVTAEVRIDDQPTCITIFQGFLSELSLEINWELCRIAGDIVRLYHRHQTPSDPPNISMQDKNNKNFLTRVTNNIHCIFAVQKTSVNFDTININATLLVKKIEASLFVSNDTDVKDRIIRGLIIAADTITSTVTSHSEELSFLCFRSPCLNLSFIETDGRENITKNLEIAGNCQEMDLIFRQDILALIEVLDLIVVDEVSQGYDIVSLAYQTHYHKQGINTRSSDKFSMPNIRVALFLDKFKMKIPLLQSLKYNISGDVFRASIMASVENEIVFNFDIKDHSHNIDNIFDQHHLSISLFNIPPTNGRITIDMSQKDITLSVVASVDPIIIDAAVMHTLLTTLNRPEISIMMAEGEKNIKKIKYQLQRILDSENFNQEPTESRAITEKDKFLYNAHLTIAGFRIFAATLGKDKNQKTARLDLDLGCIQLAVMNYFEPNRSILEYPELSIVSHRIMFELARWDQKLVEPCGNVVFAASLIATSKKEKVGPESRSYHFKINGLKINLFADTASSVLEIVGNLQNKIKDLGLSKEKNCLRKFRESQSRVGISEAHNKSYDEPKIFKSVYSLELHDVQVCWLLGTYNDQLPSGVEIEDLVVSLRRLVLSSRNKNSARLKIEDLQVQMVPTSQDKSLRSLNSALLPEIIFNVDHLSTEETRRLAFQAGGKSLDMRLASHFMIPATALKKSITSASEKFHEASAIWTKPRSGPVVEPQPRQPLLGKKRLESLFVDADFAGAVVHLSGNGKTSSYDQISEEFSQSKAGKYGKFTNVNAGNNNSDTVLRSPGLAWKVEYKDNGIDDLSFNAEIKVDASSNILYPSVVPLIMEISSSVKEIVTDEDVKNDSSKSESTNTGDINITTDPTAVLGRTKLNLGLRICRQEFSLSCQPISRVAATAQFDDIYIAVNTIHSNDHGHFLAASATIHKLKASVQHVYSREATGSFDMDKVVLSLVNSKHVSSTSGISAIINISPMKVLLNVKQLQDFLLFREIWIPKEMRQSSQAHTPTNNISQSILVQRYQQVAADETFPWDATVSIVELDVQLNLGQAIGKSTFKISNFWLSSKKNSAWEQNLCIGIDKAGVECTGRMSGFFTLENFKLRTSIKWPTHEMNAKETPLIEASLELSKLCTKAAFDYHAFLIADITSIHFFMYNIRYDSCVKGDRLVSILESEALQIFSTTISASQALALYQVFQKLIEEKQANFENSISEIEKLLNRKSTSQISSPPKITSNAAPEKMVDIPISLHTDVIVTLKAVNIGIFPNTFLDSQVLKLEALGAEARFAVKMDNGKIHSNLGLTLGQLRIGLASVREPKIPKSAGDISVQDVINIVVASRDGTILKVPKVEASMQTWQVPRSNHIDYIFKSLFEGKVEVGWNYSRISYIRSMWAAHLKALTQRLGKPLPPSAVRITSVPDGNDVQKTKGEQQKITAEVNVPQSKYNYTALEPPVIETPQLRDMGEATPPLEWIGLHRDRLPNLTHQIVIVTLLDLASEVDDAYSKILGSS